MGSTKVKRGTNSTTRKKEPLLPETVNDGNKSDKCGACGRFILLLLPILGCSFVLLSLLMLVYRLGVPITDASISTCLATYSPKVEVLVVIFLGATLMFVVTVMRNIQINVYHRRQHSESKCMRLTNLVAAIANILAYVGFVLLAIYDLDGPGNAPTIHYIGAYMYFALSGVYGLLHTFLLCKQTHYPMVCKILFTVLPIATIVCTIIYVIDMDARYEYEWFAVALAAVTIGSFTILFLVDSVDDELRDFFCCRRVRKSESPRNSSSKKSARLT